MRLYRVECDSCRWSAEWGDEKSVEHAGWVHANILCVGHVVGEVMEVPLDLEFPPGDEPIFPTPGREVVVREPVTSERHLAPVLSGLIQTMAVRYPDLDWTTVRVEWYYDELFMSDGMMLVGQVKGPNPMTIL